MSRFPLRYRYTARFCEENIWHLGHSLALEGWNAQFFKVLFLSNAQRCIPLFQQNQAIEPPYAVWDYHVILFAQDQKDGWIFDFDSRLDFPSPWAEYIVQTFPDPQRLALAFHPWIREVPWESYRQRFHSDRSHMWQAGQPLCEFPPQPPILVNDEGWRIPLQRYWDMADQLDDGSHVEPYHAWLERALAHLT